MGTARQPSASAQSAGRPYRWLKTGEEALAALLSAIDAAGKSIRLETYIYTDSPAGEKFRAALVRARQRGVRVQVMIDALGSATLSASFWDPLVEAGGEFKWFNPLSLHRLSYRDHRKICVCDGRTAFVGGFNIAEEYEGDGVRKGWRDLGMEITGPLVAELAETFDTVFEKAEFKHKRFQRLRKNRSAIIPVRRYSQLLLSGPGRRQGTIKSVLVRDLATARAVDIISGYFLPTWLLRRALLGVCQRGGIVRLILAGKSDVAISQLASRRLFAGLLKHGVEIYEYQPQILHTKLFIIDDKVFVGSANLDTRSLTINYELLVRMADPSVAAEAREIFEGDLQHCRRIERVTWRKSRTFWNKLRENWAYFVLARLDPYVARRQLRIWRH